MSVSQPPCPSPARLTSRSVRPQLPEFRHLKRKANDDEKGDDSDDDDGVIADNYRPPMPTGDRAVRSCNSAVKFVKKQ